MRQDVRPDRPLPFAPRKEDASVGQIVAITFTDRAAREMRDRIRKAIEKLAKWRLQDRSTFATSKRPRSRPSTRSAAICCGSSPFRPGSTPTSRFSTTSSPPTSVPRRCTAASTACSRTGDKTPAASLRELVICSAAPLSVDAVDSLLLQVDAAAWETVASAEPRDIAAEWTGPVRDDLLPALGRVPCAASPKIARVLNLVLDGTDGCEPTVQAKVQEVLDGAPASAECPGPAAAAVAELCDAAKVDTRRPDMARRGDLRDDQGRVDRRSATICRGSLDVFIDRARGVADDAAVCRTAVPARRLGRG